MLHLHYKAEKQEHKLIHLRCSFPTIFSYKIAALEEQLKREKAKTSQERDLLVSAEILVIFQTN